METTNRIEAEEAAAVPTVAPVGVPEASAESLGVPPGVGQRLLESREVGMCRLPGVGENVLYHPRGTEVRRGRWTVPALVVWRDEKARTLELCIVHEANDVRQQENVREWPGGEERGWEPLPSHVPVIIGVDGVAEEDIRALVDSPGHVVVNRESRIDTLARELAALRELVLGEYDEPPDPILTMLDNLDQRVDALAPKSPAAKPVKALAAKPAVKTAKKAKRKGR